MNPRTHARPMCRDHFGGALLGALAVWLSGCAAASPGRLIARQDPQTLPLASKVEEDGVYGLFLAGEAEPVFATQLRQREPIGFDQAAAATVGSLQVVDLYAVYGDHRYPLDRSKTYEWRWLHAARAR